MVIALFGDSCTGKSSIAQRLSAHLSAEVYSGKDYLRLAKSERMAEVLFRTDARQSSRPRGRYAGTKIRAV